MSEDNRNIKIQMRIQCPNSKLKRYVATTLDICKRCEYHHGIASGYVKCSFPCKLRRKLSVKFPFLVMLIAGGRGTE